MRATNQDDLAPARGCLFGTAAGLIFWLVAGLAFCSCAGADERAAAKRAERLEKIAILTAFAAIDYGQSCNAFFGAGRGKFEEQNPLLGKHPSRRDMLAFGVASLAMLLIALELLPESWGDVLLDSALTSEGMNIEQNARPTHDVLPIMVTWRF